MCQNRTESQTPLSGACANVQGQATAQLQLSNQSQAMRQAGVSAMASSLGERCCDDTIARLKLVQRPRRRHPKQRERRLAPNARG